jgi:cell wall-associated NlpC family hydrolase
VSAPNVAFCRGLKAGMQGADVIAHKRAISRWDPAVYQWANFTDYYGPAFTYAVKAFQRRNASQIPRATGNIGQTTHEVLERKHRHGSTTEWAFDTPAITLAKDFCLEYVKTPEERVREQMVAAGFYWYSHRMQIAYSQYRPYALGSPGWIPSRWDCSGFVTVCHYAGGAPDPNGRGYDGEGYTGTLCDFGSRVNDVSSLKPGDLVFYGYSSGNGPAFPPGSPTHVAMYAGYLNGVHMVLSMGSYPMGLYRFDYRSINQFRTYQVAGG